MDTIREDEEKREAAPPTAPEEGSEVYAGRWKHGLTRQVTIFFALGVLAAGILTFIIQLSRSNEEVKERVEILAMEIAQDVTQSVEEYPACGWLLEYWYEHADELDIEYDVEYWGDTETERKCRLLGEHCPDLQLKYAGSEEIEALSPDDQKLYAEITYSWFITRINQIKRTYHVDFLFCVLTEEPYDTQFFLFSAADPNSVRGTRYEEIYPLGVTVTVSEAQRAAMRTADRATAHLADAGDYVDYYALLRHVGSKAALIGLTYNVSALSADVSEETRNGTAFAMTFQIALSVLCLVLLYMIVMRPLSEVQRNIRLYKQTKDSRMITQNLDAVRQNNELGELAKDVAGLAREMDDYVAQIGTITAERERIGTELSLASRIQSGSIPHTFPPFPERTEFTLYAGMDPAKEVGGDFYDFFMIDDDHLCLVIADVSGKGVPAALFMMASMIIINGRALQGLSAAEILRQTNLAICAKNLEQMFVTVWLGILELSTGKLTASNAGHEYPVFREAGGRFELYRDKHGFVIGGLEEARYTEYTVQLTPGAKLCVYTDGVPEATAADGEMFGMQRMLDALNEDPSAGPEELLQNVRGAVDAFVQEAEQFDDLTMLCLEYHGSGAGEPS